MKFRKLSAIKIFLFLFFFIFQQYAGRLVWAASSIPSPPVVNASAVVVLDGRTGKELFSSKPDELIRTDSILPMLIAMVVLDERNPDDFILITQEAQGMTTGITGTGKKIGLKAGERLTIRQLLSSVLLANSQDACQALSSVFASDSLFLERIREKTVSLGLGNTTVTSYLIKDETTDRTTVKDMALVMKEFLAYPQLAELSRQSSYTFVPNNMVPEPRLITSTNQQIAVGGEMYYPKAIAGFLSGHPAESDTETLFVTAAQNETSQFIVALAKSARSIDNYTNSKALFDWAFNNYKAVRLIAKGEVLSNLPLASGVSLNLLAQQDIYHLGTFEDPAKPEFSLNFKPLDVTGEFIEQNQVMGSADIIIQDTVISTVNLLSSEGLSLAQPLQTSPQPTLLDRALGVLIWVILALAFAALLVFIIRTVNIYKRSLKKQQELRTKREALLERQQLEEGRKAKQQVINRSGF